MARMAKLGLMLRSAARAVRELMADTDQELAASQIEETRRALPVLAVFHFAAVAVIANFAQSQLGAGALALWGGLGLLLGMVLVASYFAIGRFLAHGAPVQRMIAAAPIIGTMLSVYWITSNFLLQPPVTDQVRDIGFVFALCMMFAGLLATLRLLATALQFLFGAVVITMLLMTEDFTRPSGAAVFSSLFSLVAFGTLVLLASISIRRRHLLLKERKRDVDLIKLLLNDSANDSRDWHWESDAEGRLRDLSPQLARLLDKPADELLGMPFAETFFGAHCPELLGLMSSRAVAVNTPMVLEQDGRQTHWLVSARPLTGSDGSFDGYRGVARDVTAQHEHEQHIAEARDLAQRALDARSQFLAVISHELRTPINAIVGFSEVLSAGQGEHLSVSARREYLGTILESAKHLQGLINEILEATRMERGTVTLDEQPNDAAELVEVTAKILRDQAAQSKISVVARVIEDVEVNGDLTRLKQVILNIMSNAIKFSPEGGVVQVDMQRLRNNDLVITVRDAGIGISDADAERVFEPFVQVENGSTRRFGGMGLGLAIARRIARLHGGDLTLKGQAGGGTEARFLLPASRVRWPSAAPKPASATAAA